MQQTVKVYQEENDELKSKVCELEKDLQKLEEEYNHQKINTEKQNIKLKDDYKEN